MVTRLVKRVLDNNYVQFGIAALIVIITLLCVFTPDLFFFKQGANFTVQIMLSFLLMGLFFLIFDLRRLLFISFGACAVLCLYLKSVSNQNMRLAEQTSEPRITIAHFNLSLSEDFETTIQTILQTDADILSFQEFTPDWDYAFRKYLSDDYICDLPLVRIDPYGLAIYSKYEFEHVDTFYSEEVPNLYVHIKPAVNRDMHIISSHTTAPVNGEAYLQIRKHFYAIRDFINTLPGSVLTIGDYNLPSWSDEIKEFKKLSNLNDSRRDIIPTTIKGTFSLFKIPIDHIFYTDDLECTNFQSITSPQATHLGIIGSYQYKTDDKDEMVRLE